MNCSNCTNYLRETKILDYSSKQIQLLVEGRGWKNLPETERVKAIYNFVKDEIFHSYVEAYVCGEWYSLEGFILDKKYLSALQKIFKPNNDGSFIGYGVATKNFINPPVEFNCCNTYIQKEGIVRDFGVYDEPDTLLKEHGQTMSALKKCAYCLVGRRLMNKNVKKIRKTK